MLFSQKFKHQFTKKGFEEFSGLTQTQISNYMSGKHYIPLNIQILMSYIILDLRGSKAKREKFLKNLSNDSFNVDDYSFIEFIKENGKLARGDDGRGRTAPTAKRLLEFWEEIN